jgi:FMN reductase
MSDVVVLVGNPRPGSRTRILAGATAAGILSTAVGSAGSNLDGPRVLELAEIGAVSFGPGPAQPSTVVDDPHGIVRGARLLVVGTPTYKGTYTGLLKVFLDQYGHRELAGVVAVPVAVAAAEPHRQAVAAGLEALLVELGAAVPVPTFAVLEQQLADPARVAARWVAENAPSIVDALKTNGANR